MITIPSLHSSAIGEIADFAELECLRNQGNPVSATSIGRVLAQDSARDDDDVRPVISAAFSDLVARAKDCGSGRRYPFRLSSHDNVLALGSLNGKYSILYQYLLFATRFNMSSNRSHGGEDGTRLFEAFCAEVARNYFSDVEYKGESLVFGTGRFSKTREDSQHINKRGFRTSVDELCHRVGEGGKFFHHTALSPVTAKDGRLDVVVWKGFKDGRPNQFIGMGQCKTGSNWRNSVDALQPANFFSKWVLSRPAILPIRMFFVAERIVVDWHEVAMDTGLLFDRCRIMQYANRISSDLFARIRAWVLAARARFQVGGE